MTGETAAGAAKPITTLAFEAPRNDWLRAGDFHDVQGSRSPAHQQDEYTLAAAPRLHSEKTHCATCRGIDLLVTTRSPPEAASASPPRRPSDGRCLRGIPHWSRTP